MSPRGFTLVELVMVLGVLAILALMTVPSLLEKAVRDQVDEALPLADIAKLPIDASWAALHSFPADNAAAGLPQAESIVGNYVNSVSVQDGAITLKFGNRASTSIRGKSLTLRPAVVAEAPIVPIAWVCGNATVPGKMTVSGVNRTDIPPLYLPLKCRP